MSNAIKHKIDEFLSQHNMSVTALERQAGVKPLLFRNLINGRSKNPSISTLIALARQIGCKIEDLLGEEFELQDDKAVKHTDLPETNLRLLNDCLSALSEELLKLGKNVPVKKVFLYLEEVYLFSLKKGSLTPDLDFLDWIIHNY